MNYFGYIIPITLQVMWLLFLKRPHNQESSDFPFHLLDFAESFLILFPSFSFFLPSLMTSFFPSLLLDPFISDSQSVWGKDSNLFIRTMKSCT